MVTTMNLMEELGQAIIAARVMSQARLQQFPLLLASMPDRREILTLPEILKSIAEIDGRIEGEIEIAPGVKLPALVFIQRMLGMLVSFCVHQFQTTRDALSSGIIRGSERRVYSSLEELYRDITSFKPRLELSLSVLEPLIRVQDQFERLYMIPQSLRAPLRRAIEDLIALPNGPSHPGLDIALDYVAGHKY